MIGQEVFICSNNFAKNYKTTWQENDTCVAVLEARLERFLKSQGISFAGTFVGFLRHSTRNFLRSTRRNQSWNFEEETIMRRCRKCSCRNKAACQACRSYYRGRLKTQVILGFLLLLAAMCAGIVLAFIMTGIFLLL